MKLCECEEEIPIARYNLGYRTCVECGEKLAKKEIERKRSCVAPAYNKGAYQYIATYEEALDIGR